MTENDEEAIRDLSRERNPRERAKRAENIEDVRADRAHMLRDQRTADMWQAESRAEELAVRTALRNERIDARFDRHDARFALINGSIEKTAVRLHSLERTLDAVREAMDKIAEQTRTRDAVEEFRAKELAVANEKQITTREFAIGVITVCILLAGLILAQSHVFGG